MRHHKTSLSGYFTLQARRKLRAVFLSSAILLLPMLQHGHADLLAGDPPDTPQTENNEQVRPQTPVPPPAVTTPPVTAPSIAQIFSVPEERSRNIFFRQTSQSIAEFRALRNDFETKGSLTRTERQLIQNIASTARKDAKEYQIPQAVAASLHFTAHQTGLEFSVLMQRLTETGGMVAGGDPAGLMPGTLFKFNVPNWLYMMKNYGNKYGFSYLGDAISVSEQNGRASVRVNDPAMLRHIISLRSNPRVSALMGAEYILNSDNIPPVVGYRGAGFRFDKTELEWQNTLMALGFDLGIRRSDGIRGPLMIASIQEFQEMSRDLIPEGATSAAFLKQVLAQAESDSVRYSNKWNHVTPEDAFAIRHASRVTGADFSYMMELVSSESGFGEEAEAKTSSAKGLMQFIEQTWLTMIYRHGDKHGLESLKDYMIPQKNNSGHVTSVTIAHPFVREYALSLRADRRISALIGAEFVKENYDQLKTGLPGRKINRTDQYIAHFLGGGQGISFLRNLERRPHHPAANLFADAAAANPNVFYKENGETRSLQEIYARFKTRFDTQFFKDVIVAETAPVTSPRPRPRPRPAPE